jgi:hypothetical protein
MTGEKENPMVSEFDRVNAEIAMEAHHLDSEYRDADSNAACVCGGWFGTWDYPSWDEHLLDALIAAGWAPQSQTADECAVIAENLLQPTAGDRVAAAIRTQYPREETPMSDECGQTRDNIMSVRCQRAKGHPENFHANFDNGTHAWGISFDPNVQWPKIQDERTPTPATPSLREGE